MNDPEWPSPLEMYEAFLPELLQYKGRLLCTNHRDVKKAIKTIQNMIKDMDSRTVYLPGEKE